MKKKEATGYWRQACEALDTTQMALLRENHNNALTIGYQAMEHAAKALLAANDVETGSHHVAEREKLTETGLGSTARCRGRRRHRQANSVRAGVVQTLSVQQAQPTDDN